MKYPEITPQEYKKQTNEIKKNLLQIIMRMQRKVTDVKYRETLEKLQK